MAIGSCPMISLLPCAIAEPRANLKKAMQRLPAAYAIRFNFRHRRARALFQGRYRHASLCLREIGERSGGIGLRRVLSSQTPYGSATARGQAPRRNCQAHRKSDNVTR